MSAPKCSDCGTSVNVHPWGYQLQHGWRYEWRCGPCQYRHEHPDAALLPPTPRKPKRPQAETLDDAPAGRDHPGMPRRREREDPPAARERGA